MRTFAKPALMALLAALLMNQAAFSADQAAAQKFYQDAIGYYTRGDSGHALELFEKAIAADPSYTDAYFNMGSVYFATGVYDRAIHNFRRVLDVNANDAQARYSLALAHEKLGQYREAVAQLKQIPPENRKYRIAQQKLSELGPKALNSFYKTGPDTAVSDKKNYPEISAIEANPKTATLKAPKPAATNAKLAVETFAKGFYGPTGIAIGPNGNLYVANYSKNLIYRVGEDGSKTVFAEGGAIKGPLGMVFNPRTGELYVANYLDNNIARIAKDGKASVLASGVNKPYSLMLDTLSNTLYISEQESNTVSKINLF